MSVSTPVRPYRYEAINRDGEIDSGEIVATSSDQVAERLRRSGVRPVCIRPQRRSQLQREFNIPGFRPRVKPEELSVVARQFATMIDAGVPLVQSLEVLSEQMENQLLKRTLASVKTSVLSGESLSSAIGSHPRVFDPLFVSIVRSGESAGALGVVLQQLARTLERTAATRRKVRSALAYPTMVLVMVGVIISAMLVFVVPVFRGVYADLGGTLPLPTLLLVEVSDLLSNNLPVVLGASVLSVHFFRRWRSSKSGAVTWDKLILKAPLIGTLIHKTAMARVGRTMSVLLRTGVPVVDALELAADSAGNAVVRKALLESRAGIARGERLAENLSQDRVFPPMVIQLVTVGEETGSLDDMFEIVGRTYENEVEVAVAGLAALIEPLLMAFIGCVVGAMVISLYLPMFRIIDLVQ